MPTYNLRLDLKPEPSADDLGDIVGVISDECSRLGFNDWEVGLSDDPVDRWLVEEALRFVAIAADAMHDDHYYDHNECPNAGDGEVCGLCETVDGQARAKDAGDRGHLDAYDNVFLILDNFPIREAVKRIESWHNTYREKVID